MLVFCFAIAACSFNTIPMVSSEVLKKDIGVPQPYQKSYASMLESVLKVNNERLATLTKLANLNSFSPKHTGLRIGSKEIKELQTNTANGNKRTANTEDMESAFLADNALKSVLLGSQQS